MPTVRQRILGLLVFQSLISFAFADGRSEREPTRGEDAAGTVRVVGRFPDEQSRNGYTATRLNDGSLFVYGAVPTGSLKDGAFVFDVFDRSQALSYVQPGAEFFDAKRHGWSKHASPSECPYTLFLHTSTLLPSQKILFAGGVCDTPSQARQIGVDPTSAYRALSLWDSGSRRWEAIPSLQQGRVNHTATLLDDGNVLIVGGHADRRERREILPVFNSVELFRDAKGSQPAQVVSLAPLQNARAQHTATRLANSNVLVVGGRGAEQTLASTEIFDAQSQVWREGPALKTRRYKHSALLLNDGRVMVIGGLGSDGKAIASVEIFDSKTNQWSSSAPLLFPLDTQSAVTLANGDVLIAGTSTNEFRQSIAFCMLWKKSDEQWRLAGNLRADGLINFRELDAYRLIAEPDGNALILDQRLLMRWTPSEDASYYPATHRITHSSTLLTDGRILLAGGRTGSNPTTLSELFDPVSNQFTVTSPMQQARYTGMPYQSSLASILLDDGRVVVAGGWVMAPDNYGLTVANFPDLWNPNTGKWSVIEELRFEAYDHVFFNRLHDGRVLFFVSREQEDKGVAEFKASIWNPRTNQIRILTVGAKPRTGASITVLQDGRVLIIGGRRPDWIDGYRCPVRSTPTLKGNDESDEQTPCQDEPAHWQFVGTQTAELWDSRSESTLTLSYPPSLDVTDCQSLLLKSGDVIVTHVDVPRPFGPTGPRAAWLWNTRSQSFSELPKFPTTINWPITEGPDGDLIAWGVDNVAPSEVFRLRKGATRWTPMPRFPQEQATVVTTKAGELLALAQFQPNIAVWNEELNEWDLKQSTYLPTNNPALIETLDGKVAVIGTIAGNRYTVQVWNPKTEIWSIGSVSRKTPSSLGKAVRLKSGEILTLGLGQASRLICDIWNIAGDPSGRNRKECGTLAPAGSDDFHQFTLAALEDGRPVVIANTDNARVFEPDSGEWKTVKAEWNLDNAHLGEAVRTDRPLLRLFDESHATWLDAEEAGGRYYSTGQQRGRTPSLLWDRSKRRWAFISFDTIGKNAAWLPDGCAISGPPFVIYSTASGHAAKFPEPFTGLDHSVMTVLSDGTVFVVGTNNGSAEANAEFFHRKATCAGLASEPSDEFFPPHYTVASSDSPPISVATTNARAEPPLTETLATWFREYRGILFLIAGIAVVIVCVRLVIHRLQEGLPESGLVQEEDNTLLDRLLSLIMRLLLYGILLVVIIRFVFGFGGFRIMRANEECADLAGTPGVPRSEQLAKCINDKANPLSALSRDDKHDAGIPCRFVGIWSMTKERGQMQSSRVTLFDTGQYQYDERGLSRVGVEPVTGYWEVQGENMVWRHKLTGNDPDVNKILHATDSSFTLVEQDETRTDFQLIEPLKSERCAQSPSR